MILNYFIIYRKIRQLITPQGLRVFKDQVENKSKKVRERFVSHISVLTLQLCSNCVDVMNNVNTKWNLKVTCYIHRDITGSVHGEMDELMRSCRLGAKDA